MHVITTVAELQNIVKSAQTDKKTIGFVPTMGALHAGHLALIEQCIADSDLSIVSIFVNPTQFNNKEDLEKYPRDLDRDCKYLKEVGVDIVFAPTVNEVYPEPDTRVFDFGQIDKVMEGKHRPGHFNGVAQVVSRLFDIVRPQKAYFGEKDFQQLAVIRTMVEQLSLNIEIIPMPIVREKSGLALSSRNERLSEEQKINATQISKILFESKKWADYYSTKETSERVIDYLNSIESLKVEYFEIVDGSSLESVAEWNDSSYIVGCIAVFCGDVRLIDNVVYKVDSKI